MFPRHLALALILVNFTHAEVITLITGNRSATSPQPAFSQKTITLEEGDLLTTKFVSNEAYVDVTIENILVRIDANDPDQRNLPVIKGPATIRLANLSNFNASLATFSIQRATDTPAPSSQVVVIPDDGAGDREVTLESSTDMVNWTPTQAGIFGSANLARFFRVRITKQPSE